MPDQFEERAEEIGESLRQILENASPDVLEAVARYAENTPEFQKELDEVCGWTGLSGESDVILED